MLILKRRTNERIRIADDVEIVVLKSRGNTVRIGIEAPEHVKILRGELVDWREKQNDNKGAA